MNIGLVGQRLLIDDPAGVEKYIYNVFHNLALVDKANKYTIYVPHKPKKTFWEELVGDNENFKYKVVKPFISWTQISLAWELLIHPQDVVFYPTDTVSGLLNFLAPLRFKPVCMVHDLGYTKTKEYSNILKQVLHYFTVWYTLIFCKRLIVPSVRVKQSIFEHYPLFRNDKKVIVIPEGLNPNFCKRNKGEIDKVKEEYSIVGDYLYFVSTIQPRKNIPKMIQAFSMVIKENEKYNNMKLIISGKKGWKFNESLDAPKKFGIENNVKFIGRNTDYEVSTLMSGAKALINLSLEEGFGLPLLEAMACETPLLLSDIEVYKEVAGKYAVYADPYDLESMKKGILEIIEKQYPREYITNAKDITARFTWEMASKNTLTVFKSLTSC